MEILFAIIVVAVIVIAIVVGVNHAKEDKAEGVTATFANLRLAPTELIEGYGVTAKRHSLVGLVASVEDSGTLNRRMTATRMVTLGMFALAAPKKQDDREVYLTVEGPNTAILRKVAMKNAPSAGTRAREFAAKLNLATRQLGTGDQPELAN